MRLNFGIKLHFWATLFTPHYQPMGQQQIPFCNKAEPRFSFFCYPQVLNIWSWPTYELRWILTPARSRCKTWTSALHRYRHYETIWLNRTFSKGSRVILIWVSISNSFRKTECRGYLSTGAQTQSSNRKKLRGAKRALIRDHAVLNFIDASHRKDRSCDAGMSRCKTWTFDFQSVMKCKCYETAVVQLKWYLKVALTKSGYGRIYPQWDPRILTYVNAGICHLTQKLTTIQQPI